MSIRPALFDRFVQAINIVNVNTEKIHFVEHLNFDLALVERHMHVRSAAVEAKIKPGLVCNVVAWSLDLTESVVATVITHHLRLLRLQQVREHSLPKIS